MRIRTGIAVLLAAAMAGCAANMAYQPAAPVSVESTGVLAAPELGVVVDEKLQIVYVIPSSAADRAGIHVGDILIALVPLDEGDPDRETNKQPRQIASDVIDVPSDKWYTHVPPELLAKHPEMAGSADGTHSDMTNAGVLTIPVEYIEMPWNPADEVTETISFQDREKAHSKIWANGDRILKIRLRRGDGDRNEGAAFPAFLSTSSARGYTP